MNAIILNLSQYKTRSSYCTWLHYFLQWQHKHIFRRAHTQLAAVTSAQHYNTDGELNFLWRLRGVSCAAAGVGVVTGLFLWLGLGLGTPFFRKDFAVAVPSWFPVVDLLLKLFCRRERVTGGEYAPGPSSAASSREDFWMITPFRIIISLLPFPIRGEVPIIDTFPELKDRLKEVLRAAGEFRAVDTTIGGA